MNCNIYFDLDDVICDTTSVIVNECNSIYGKNSCIGEIYSFDLKESLRLTEEQHLNLMKHVHKEVIQMKMRPISNSISILENLKSRGYNIFIVTGRPPSTNRSTEKWLKANRVPYDELIFVNKYNRPDKNTGNTNQITFKELSRYRFTAIVDDSPRAALLALSELTSPIIFFIRPWNKEFSLSLKDNPRIHICHNWTDIHAALVNGPHKC